jgi:hypothetical protein
MRPRDLLVVAALVVAGAWFVIVWAYTPSVAVSFDIYSYYLPNILYALQRLGDGGEGLLWNKFQNCGQPSLGLSSTGPLYPLNLLFLVLPAQQALDGVIVANFAIAGIAMYALARELGTSRAAAFCGALAFELGTATVDLSTWGPQMSSPHVWTPAALLFCERLLRAPSPGNAIGLGIVLAVPLLPGFPQSVVFTYQLVALRAVFELVTRRMPRPWYTFALLALGLVLAPLLDAVQLVPAIEMASQSVRSDPLTMDEIRSGGFLTWEHVRLTWRHRFDLLHPFIVVPCVIAGASWLHAPTRRRAVFYTLAGVLFMLLALGPATPVFDLYLRLPLGRMFREPGRFTWAASFCLAVLTAFGTDAILQPPRDAPWWRRWSPVGLCAAALVAVYFVIMQRLLPSEWTFVALVFAGAVLARLAPSWQRLAAAFVIAGTAANLLSYESALLPLDALMSRRVPLRRHMADTGVLYAQRDLLDGLRRRMSPQDRLYILHQHPSYSLMAKTASLFQLPAIQDYEPQPTRRSAAYWLMLNTGAPMRNLLQYYFQLAPKMPASFRRRLLDLAAARYVIADAKVDNTTVLSPPLVRLDVSADRTINVYDNPQALPRARFVPFVGVVRDTRVLLQRLAWGIFDLRQMALLEEPPPSGFHGNVAGAATGVADIVVDEPERVVVRVRAPARGFLHLADQYFPGWHATVNGAPAPIMRANYLFRLVEVPAGESTVEFRYRPASVRIGAAISAATVLALIAAAIVRSRRRDRREPGCM